MVEAPKESSKFIVFCIHIYSLRATTKSRCLNTPRRTIIRASRRVERERDNCQRQSVLDSIIATLRDCVETVLYYILYTIIMLWICVVCFRKAASRWKTFELTFFFASGGI